MSPLRIFGVPVRFHFTFLLVVFLLVYNGFTKESGALTTALYIAGLFGSVLAHELGHALTARRFGVPTVEIVMYPIGGVAKLGRSPEPREEIWITAAGPLVNFVLAGLIIAFLATQGTLGSIENLKQETPQNLLMRLAAANLGLGIFNLLPAFPMDGGRLLRAVLALRLNPTRATAISSQIGKGLAMLMGIYGVMSGMYGLVFIAIFVFLGASQENLAVQQRSLLQNVPVRDAMITDYHTLTHGNTLKEAADLLLTTSQTDFPVVSGASVVGLLSRGALLQGLASEGPEAYVAGVMQRGFRMIPPDSDLGQLLAEGQLSNETALVMEGETLVGLLTPENLGEYLAVRQMSARGTA
jgi:Zn-dependent protease/CBS domain-containing protein